MSKNIVSKPLAHRQVAARRGIVWLVRAFQLFARSPIIWLLCGALFLFGLLIISAILLASLPVLSPLIAIPTTIFIAGVCYASAQSDQGKGLRFEWLFHGFDFQLKPLSLLGLLYGLGNVFIALLAEAIVQLSGFELAPVELSSLPPTLLPTGYWLLLLIYLALMIPLLMAYWFAPALIILGNTTVKQSLLLSYRACRDNWLPFTVFALYALLFIFAALFLVAFSALISISIAVLLQFCVYFAAIPITLISIYTAYCDLFLPDVDKKPEAEDHLVL
jgi:hypothetical protein